AVLVVEEVGVDRSGEAGIVQLEAQIVAPLVGGFAPGGADFGPADIDPVAGRVVAAAVGLGDDADTLGLDAQGDDLAVELVAALLEGADGGHGRSPWMVSRAPRPSRPRW